MSANVLEGLEPKVLWQRFFEISQVPRPSKNEGKVVEYLKNFAKENNLEIKSDEVDNLVIKVPATPGYEKAPVVIIQGHVDMVCEKNKGTEHDFDNDPIKLVLDGEWVTAEGTTLGADNGIGVAAGLACVHDNSFDHGPLELLLTVDEETGLTGANNLKPGFVEGKMLLNLDSEEDGVFYIGCSGGQDTVGYFEIEYEDAVKEYVAVEVMVDGFMGGHSGLDADKGRGNAIKVLARYLKSVDELDYQLAEIQGGSKRNAIPREAEATLLVPAESIDDFAKAAEKVKNDVLMEYKTQDGGLNITVTKVNKKYDKVFSDEFAYWILNVLHALPHGVLAMSHDIEGLVESSTNLATINMEDGKLRIGTSQRSSVEPAKMFFSGMVESVFELAGADDIQTGDGYPGWQPDMGSALLAKAREVYKTKFSEDADLKAIHAGLECGILGDKYPGMDMISYGPTIMNAHSPDEKLHIHATEKFWELTKAILETIAKS